MAKRAIQIAYVISVLTFLVLIFNIIIPGHSEFTFELHNSGHTPAFGILSILILWGIRLFVNNTKRNALRHYLIAFTLAVTTGVAIEFIQYLGPRDADFVDIVRNIAGIASFLGLYSFFDKYLKSDSESKIAKYKVLVLILAALILAISLTPLAIISVATYGRDTAFPSLITFEHWWEGRFAKTYNADLESVASPFNPSDKRDKAGKLTFKPDKYSTFALNEPYPDWSDYNYLKFDIYSPLDTKVKIGMRSEDFAHNDEHEDRFNYQIEINPGINFIEIPLNLIESGPTTRSMNMSQIGPTRIFVYDIPYEFSIIIDNFRLE